MFNDSGENNAERVANVMASYTRYATTLCDADKDFLVLNEITKEIKTATIIPGLIKATAADSGLDIISAGWDMWVSTIDLKWEHSLIG